MISPNRLVRIAEQSDFDRLLVEVSRNGRPLPVGARLRLSEGASLAATALGLALQRILELSYAPSARTLTLADDLIARQDSRGSFGCVASTSVAVAGLLAVRDRISFTVAPHAEALLERIDRAVDLALHHLHAARTSDLFGESPALIADPLDTAITLWQLEDRDEFTALFSLDSLEDALAESGALADRTCAAVLALRGVETAARPQLGIAA
ncbi:MAG: hypothetical protein VYC34_11025 [Planctomycetota bacterium]|nr:hypothetical protein [Planctomycetota bacterium]